MKRRRKANSIPSLLCFNERIDPRPPNGRKFIKMSRVMAEAKLSLIGFFIIKCREVVNRNCLPCSHN